MSRYADFLVEGEPESVRFLGDEIVRDAGFMTVWNDRASGYAERGSVTLTVVLGAFAGKRRQAMKIGLEIFAGPQPGTTALRITRISSGWLAGIIGASRKKMFADLIEYVASSFRQVRRLLDVVLC